MTVPVEDSRRRIDMAQSSHRFFSTGVIFLVEFIEMDSDRLQKRDLGAEGKTNICRRSGATGFVQRFLGVVHPRFPLGQIPRPPEIQAGAKVRKTGPLQLRDEMAKCFVDRAKGLCLKRQSFIMKDGLVSFLDALDVHQAIKDALSLVLPFNLVSLGDALHQTISRMAKIIASSSQAINNFFGFKGPGGRVGDCPFHTDALTVSIPASNP